MIIVAPHLSWAENPALVAAAVLACTVSSPYAIFPAEADSFLSPRERLRLGLFTVYCYPLYVVIPARFLPSYHLCG